MRVADQLFEEWGRVEILRHSPPLQSQFELTLVGLVYISDRRDAGLVSGVLRDGPDRLGLGLVSFRGQA